MHGSRSIYHEGWKATSNFVSPLFNERAHIEGSHSYDTDVWKLFDLNRDFSESTDLAADHPELLARMEQLWIDQATANDVFPLFDPAANYPAHPHEYPLPRRMSYAPSSHPIAAGRVPSMFGGFVIEANIGCHGLESGALVGLGDHQGGWILHLVDGEPRFDVVYGHQRAHLAAGTAVGAGEHTLEVTMSAGDLTLNVDGTTVATGRFGGLFMFPGVTTAAGGMWVGRHEGLPVVDSCSAPAVFTGELHHVTVTSGSPKAGPTLATTMRIAEGSD